MAVSDGRSAWAALGCIPALSRFPSSLAELMKHFVVVETLVYQRHNIECIFRCLQLNYSYGAMSVATVSGTESAQYIQN
jgi:hypothetical protein